MSDPLLDSLDIRAYEFQRRLDAEIDPPNDRRELSARLGRYLAMTEAEGREPFEAALRPQRERDQRVRSLFTSPDVPGLASDYTGPDAQEFRQRTAAITHFANASGKDLESLALRWPNVRAEYSLANLGKPDASDGEVFNHIAAGYSLDEQIATTAAKAGTLGKASLKAWQEHAETFKGSPAWSEAQRDGYRQRFTEAADRVSSRLAPYRETINATVSDLKRIMGTETGDTAADWSDLANRLLDVPKKDRAHVIKAITEIGQAADPDAAKGFGDDATAKAMNLQTARAAGVVAQKLGEAVYRGAVPFATGLPDAMARASILSMRQNLDSVQVPVGFTGDVARYALAESMRPVMRAVTGGEKQIGGAVDAILALAAPSTRNLTDEEKGATRAAIDRAIEADEMAQQIKDIADQKIDPIRSDALVMRGIYGAARSVPMTAGALIPGGGLFIAGQFANDNYHQILRENPDMPRETAQGIAVLSAPLQAVTEVISDRFLVGRLPNFARVVKAPVTTWATAARRAGGFAAAGMVTETGEEIAQDLTPYAVQAVVGALGVDVSDVPWGTITANMNANKWELIASIVPLVLVGAGGGQLADLGQGRALAARPELLEASGYSAKDSAAIATAAQEGDWNTAQNLMRASYEAGGVEFDGAKLETQRTTAVEAIKAETSEAGQMQATLQRADLVPSFERDGSGWKARYQDGSEIQVGSAAEAMDLARAHMNETEFAVAESTGRMADFLAGQQRAGEAAPVVTHSPFEALLLKSDVETGVVSRENALEASRVRIAQMDAAETADVEKTIAAGMAEGLTKEDATLEAFGILGSNKVERADNLRQLAIRIGQGSDVTTPVQEFAEGRWQAGLASGRYTMEQGVSWVRTAERVTGQKFLHLAPGETIAADGKVSPAALTEAISQIVVFNTVGRRKDGTRAPAGLVTRGLKASIKRMAEIEAARATGDAKQLSLFAHFLRSFRAMFGRAFAAASALRRARESGALGEDFDSFLDDLIGTDPQSRFERETAKEAEALIAEADPEYVPPSAEDEAGGMAFSLVAKRHPELEAKHNAGTITPEETAEAQRIVDAAAKGAGMKELWTGRRSAPSDPLKLVGSIWERPTWFTNERRVAVRYARGSYNPMPTPRKWVKRFMVDLKNPFTYEKSKEVWEYLDSHLPEEAPFTPEEESSDENAADSGVIRDALQRLGFDGVHYTGDDMTGEGDAHESYLVFSPSQIKSADPFTGVPLEERFNPQSENIRYSLAPRALLDKLQGDIERRMAKRPELLGDYMKIARGKFVKMRADVETFRGDIAEGLDSKADRTRTMADLEIERRARQKARETELVEQGMNGLSRETLDAFHSDAALGDARTHPVIAQLIVADAKQIGGFRGRLRHPSQAAANMANQYDDMPEGLPRWMFGGTLDPDQAASDLGFEYTGDLWKAIGEAFNSARTFKESFLNAREAVRTVEKSAKDTAKTESLAWMDEARANVPSRKERMINALRTLHAIASGFPAEVRGRMGSVVRLASLETDEARLAEITRKLDMLEKAAERYLKKFFLGKIEDLFEKAKKPLGDAGDKMKGKLGPDGHRLFKVAEAASNATAEEADRMLASIENHLADPLITAEEEALAMRERELVSLLADLSHADASRAESAFKALHDIYFTGLAAWKAKLIAIRERREKSREEKKAATGKEGTRNERKTAEIAAAKPAGWTLRQMLDYSSFHQVANYVFGEKDALDLVDSERQASNAYDDGISAIEEDTAEFFTKLAGGNLAGQKLRYRLATVHSINGGQAGQMTPMEAIQALLMWRQEDGQRHMDGPKDEDGKPSGSWHYDQAWIDSIDSQLKPEARAVMSFIADRYSREHAPLNALYRERHGVDLPSHQYYAPLTVKPMQAKAGEVVDPVSGFSTSGNSITPGSLRTRSRRAVAEPDFKDALAVFLGHSRQIEYWKAYYDFSMEANAVLGNVEVANAVEAKAGKEALTVIRKFLDVFAMGGVRDSGAGLANHNTLSRAVSRASSAAILGRVSTLLVQTTQLAAASVKMPLGSYALRFGKLLTGQLAWSDAINSPFIQRRVRMQEPIAREAMKALGEASRPNAIKHHARKLGALLGGTDGLFTAGTYAILLDYHRGQGARLGMSGADLDAYAHQEAERATEEVAQPMRAGTKSIAELTNTSPLSRSLWAFASESRQKMMLLAWAGHAIKGGNTAQAAQFAKVAFLVFGVGGLYVQILKNLWREAKGDDEEDKWSAWNMGRAVLTAPATGVAGFSAVVEASGGLLSSFGRAVPAIEALWDDDEDTSEATMRHVETLLMSASLFSETAAGLASFMHLAVDALKLTNNATENTPTAPPQ